MESGGKFQHHTIKDAKTIQEYFAAIAEGMAKGRLCFQSKGKELVLKPGGMISLSVEAGLNGGCGKLSLNFSWREEKEDSAKDDPLVIKAGW